MNKSQGAGTTLQSLLGDRYPFADKKNKRKDKENAAAGTKMPPRSWEHLSLDLEPHTSLMQEAQNNNHSASPAPSKTSLGFGKGFPKSPNPANVTKTHSPKSNLSPKSNPSPKSSALKQQQQPQQVIHTNDITIYVGKTRTPYVVSIESLNSSSYFRKMIMRSHASPVVVDCEESVFENVMAVLRYKSTDALPQLSDSEKFKLKRELEFLGIDIPEDLQSRRSQQRQGHFPIADLPDFPAELTDPSKLVIVARLEDTSRKGKCECMSIEKPTQWALSFHFRQAFCIGCSQPPSSRLAPKTLIEMFQAAALYFSHPDKVSSKKWFVICDSTCTLRFITPKPCCVCPCSVNKKKVPMWAVNSYHCHAFCTACGKYAQGSMLVCIMFTLRYGGGPHKSLKPCLAASTSRKETLLPSPENASSSNLSPTHSLSQVPCQQVPCQHQSPPRVSISSQPSL